MSNLTVSVKLTKNGNQPATGLTLTDILITVKGIKKSNLDVVDIWTGVNPTDEVQGMGRYLILFTTYNPLIYDYVVEGEYIGAEVLDSNYVGGTISALSVACAIMSSEWFY